MVEYKVNMTSSTENGWQGWIFGLKRNDQIFFEFGENFTEGSSMNLSNIEVQLNTSLEIVVVKRGTF